MGDWQEISALAIVALTAALMLRGAFRKRVSGTAGGGQCCDNCPAASGPRKAGALEGPVVFKK